MTAERWTRDVRQRLGLGRLLPLGGPRDGAWLAEAAALAFLGRVAAGVPGVALGAARIGLADPADVAEPVVPAPPSGLPPGPLRVTAEFSATAAEPLPATADRLRAALVTAATEGLGLTVAEVDLRVTDLLEENPVESPAPTAPPATAEPALAGSVSAQASPAQASPAQAPGVGGGVGTGTGAAAGTGVTAEGAVVAGDDTDETRATAAALAVPGVARLTSSLSGLGRPVHLEERGHDGPALPHLHARVEIAVVTGHRPVEVARAVRAAVTQALPERPTVAVLVTAID
ncbi:nucleopolyhedrovirus P10 family protein [Streptomyces sp. NPDC058731]|uniref:nucleopolyhedrovirus P10 family protein n=1 Tax=Streptomyces sp. NPDC058731 TaxID=3346613 RepID=UPI0036D15C44